MSNADAARLLSALVSRPYTHKVTQGQINALVALGVLLVDGEFRQTKTVTPAGWALLGVAQ